MLDDVEIETLLKVVLLLVILWLVVDIVSQLLYAVLEPLSPFIGLVIVALLVVWLVDRY